MRDEQLKKTHFYRWKEKSVRFQGRDTDIITMRVPLDLNLQPHESPRLRDAFRIRVDHLPEDVSMDVTFVGVAQAIDITRKDLS